jgi:hypothetical protein
MGETLKDAGGINPDAAFRFHFALFLPEAAVLHRCLGFIPPDFAVFTHLRGEQSIV